MVCQLPFVPKFFRAVQYMDYFAFLNNEFHLLRSTLRILFPDFRNRIQVADCLVRHTILRGGAERLFPHL